MTGVSVLGSTGSIGVQALEVIAGLPGRLRVTALAAGRNVARIREQAVKHRPALVSVAREEDARALRPALGALGIRVASGVEGAIEVSTWPESRIVVAAMVGAAGVLPTLRAVEARRDVAVANKEVLVVAGDLLTRAASRTGARILPVDSEHSAIHQCLRSGTTEEIRRIVLTASGGPFRELPLERFAEITPEEALRHPNWSMGRKITVDSATMMNKGLEVIEAHHLFALSPGRIDVVVHPQSIVHSMVEFRDGSVIAQLSATDMTLPIQYALTWPERLERPFPRLDLLAFPRLDFQEADPARFPCLRLARRALEAGGGAPAVLNAANEVAVEEFLGGRIRFPAIAAVIEEVLDALGGERAEALESLLDLDREARGRAREAAARIP